MSGASTLGRDGPFETTVSNAQGRLRYAYFFAERWSVFGMVAAQDETFQQLERRMNIDRGVALHVLPGVEYLRRFTTLTALRVNFDAGLTASVSQQFSIFTNFTLRYDNNPVPAVERLDTVTAVNLAYRVL